MNGLQDCGRSNAGFPAHWIQHAIGAVTDSAHGDGLAVIQPAWLTYINRKRPEKFVQFSARVFGLERKADMSDVEYGQAGIDALKSTFKAWGLPSTLKELGVKEEMLPGIIDRILHNNESFVFTEEELNEVLKQCMD